MKVLIEQGPEEAAQRAAGLLADRIRANPHSVLGVATGSSPLGVYRALVERRKAGLDTTRLRLVALDEYVGLEAEHPQSYRRFLADNVATPLGIGADSVLVPAGWKADLALAAREFEGAIESLGGVQTQILGIGRNGHIGFNEPTSSLVSRTRLKTLSPETRLDNSRFFGRLEDVPVLCLTQGLGTIRDAAEILLIALGAPKAQAIAAAIEGPISASCPASVLQMHPSVTMVLDEDAASMLQMRDYYKFVDAQDRSRHNRQRSADL